MDGREKGLESSSATIDIKGNGQPCATILDSGSQMTIVFEKWYHKYLPKVPIHPTEGLVDYVVVEKEFPATFVGAAETPLVPALVLP